MAQLWLHHRASNPIPILRLLKPFKLANKKASCEGGRWEQRDSCHDLYPIEVMFSVAHVDWCESDCIQIRLELLFETCFINVFASKICFRFIFEVMTLVSQIVPPEMPDRLDMEWGVTAWLIDQSFSNCVPLKPTDCLFFRSSMPNIQPKVQS